MRIWPYARIVAHRGGGKLAPENTLEAIDVGARLGLRMIEFDAKFSADDVVFLLHDDDVDRTSDSHGAVRTFPYRTSATRCGRVVRQGIRERAHADARAGARMLRRAESDGER